MGALSFALRFQRPLREGMKAAPGGRPASRQKKSELPGLVCRSKHHNITHPAGFDFLVLGVKENIVEKVGYLVEFIIVVDGFKSHVLVRAFSAKNYVLLAFFV